MPRKDSREEHWVPTVARVLCYMCGLRFDDERDKTNCRFCYDVFCNRCIAAAPIMLPSSYGYDEPQPVCLTCDHLVHAFPMFAAQIAGKRGGQLLDRRHRIITVSTIGDDTPPSPTQGSAPTQDSNGNAKRVTTGSVTVPNSAQVRRRPKSVVNPPPPPEDTGILSSIKRFFGGKKAEKPFAANAGHRGSGSGGSTASVVATTPKGRQAMRAERATTLELHSWRPISVDSALVCEGGATRVYLREIKAVEFKEHVVMTLVDGRHVEFIVLQFESECSGDSELQDGKDDAFVVDAAANYTLATGLASLVKLCKHHFALNPSASFAMHRDVQENATR